MEVHGNMRVGPSENVVFRELESEGGGVLLRLDDGAYHGLNQMGCVIWSMVGGGVQIDELVSELQSTVEDAPGSMRTEVEAFVTALVDRGLLVVQDHE
jgi:hypothetical protein